MTDRTVVATRTLEVEGRRRPAVVSLYAPRQVAKDEWACAYHVTGMRKAKEIYGVDAVQALSNAMQGVRVHLDNSRYRYTWIGGEPGNHGFEHTIPNGFGIAFARRMGGLIDHEIVRFVQRERRRRRQRRG